MKIGLIVLFALYLIKLFINRGKVKKEFDEATQELHSIVRQTLGKSALDALKEKGIWLGMPKCLIYYCFGEPHDTVKTVNKEGVYENFYFGPLPYKYGGQTKYKYKREIHTTDSLVTNIKKN